MTRREIIVFAEAVASQIECDVLSARGWSEQVKHLKAEIAKRDETIAELSMQIQNINLRRNWFV